MENEFKVIDEYILEIKEYMGCYDFEENDNIRPLIKDLLPEERFDFTNIYKNLNINESNLKTTKFYLNKLNELYSDIFLVASLFNEKSSEFIENLNKNDEVTKILMESKTKWNNRKLFDILKLLVDQSYFINFSKFLNDNNNYSNEDIESIEFIQSLSPKRKEKYIKIRDLLINTKYLIGEIKNKVDFYEPEPTHKPTNTKENKLDLTERMLIIAFLQKYDLFPKHNSSKGQYQKQLDEFVSILLNESIDSVESAREKTTIFFQPEKITTGQKPFKIRNLNNIIPYFEKLGNNSILQEIDEIVIYINKI